MASRVASISVKEILSMKEVAVPKNTKGQQSLVQQYLMVSYLISPASYSKAKNQNTMQLNKCLQKFYLCECASHGARDFCSILSKIKLFRYLLNLCGRY